MQAIISALLVKIESSHRLVSRKCLNQLSHLKFHNILIRCLQVEEEYVLIKQINSEIAEGPSDNHSVINLAISLLLMLFQLNIARKKREEGKTTIHMTDVKFHRAICAL